MNNPRRMLVELDDDAETASFARVLAGRILDGPLLDNGTVLLPAYGVGSVFEVFRAFDPGGEFVGWVVAGDLPPDLLDLPADSEILQVVDSYLDGQRRAAGAALQGHFMESRNGNGRPLPLTTELATMLLSRLEFHRGEPGCRYLRVEMRHFKLTIRPFQPNLRAKTLCQRKDRYNIDTAPSRILPSRKKSG